MTLQDIALACCLAALIMFLQGWMDGTIVVKNRPVTEKTK